MHHGQPGGDVHGPADAVQQDVRDGPRPEDGRARRSSGFAQSQIRTTPVSRQLFLLIFLIIFFVGSQTGLCK